MSHSVGTAWTTVLQPKQESGPVSIKAHPNNYHDIQVRYINAEGNPDQIQPGTASSFHDSQCWSSGLEAKAVSGTQEVLVIHGSISTAFAISYTRHVDEYSQGFQMVTSEHAKIHDGMHFYAEAYEPTIDAATPKHWVFEAQPEGVKAHMLYALSISNVGVLKMFHSPDLSDKGTEIQDIFASNCEHSETNQANVYRDPTIDNKGTEMAI